MALRQAAVFSWGHRSVCFGGGEGEVAWELVCFRDEFFLQLTLCGRCNWLGSGSVGAAVREVEQSNDCSSGSIASS